MGALGSLISGAVTGIAGVGLASWIITALSGDDSQDTSETEEE